MSVQNILNLLNVKLPNKANYHELARELVSTLQITASPSTLDTKKLEEEMREVSISVDSMMQLLNIPRDHLFIEVLLNTIMKPYAKLEPRVKNEIRQRASIALLAEGSPISQLINACSTRYRQQSEQVTLDSSARMALRLKEAPSIPPVSSTGAPLDRTAPEETPDVAQKKTPPPKPTTKAPTTRPVTSTQVIREEDKPSAQRPPETPKSLYGGKRRPEGPLPTPGLFSEHKGPTRRKTNENLQPETNGRPRRPTGGAKT